MTEIGVETLQDTNLVQKLFHVVGVAKIEILIESITIDIGDLLRYNAPEGRNDDLDVPTDEKEWDTEYDEGDDSDNIDDSSACKLVN